MKQLLLFTLLLSLCFGQTNGQGLTPSTVRQVFSLEKGDSLEYHIWTTAQICQTTCDVYKLRVVDTTYHNSLGDSLFIKFKSYELHRDSASPSTYCSNGCFYYVDGLIAGYAYNDSDSLWTLSHLDSSVVQIDTMFYWVTYNDSIISDPTKYNGCKQNFIDWNQNIIADGIDVFADSIGVVYHQILSTEAGKAQNEELVYYHKANGKRWGVENPYTGINDVKQEDALSVYPNPTNGRFTVSTDQYRNAILELFDILGKKIMTLTLKAKDTEVNSNNLPSGIYLWYITKDNQSIKTGKLIID